MQDTMMAQTANRVGVIIAPQTPRKTASYGPSSTVRACPRRLATASLAPLVPKRTGRLLRDSRRDLS